MTAPDLKPCPFCGHQPKLWGEDGNIHGVQIECVNGRCPSEPHVWGKTSAEAIAAWNTRPTPLAEALAVPEVKTLVEALRLLHDNVVLAFPALADLGPVANARAVLRAIGDGRADTEIPADAENGRATVSRIRKGDVSPTSD